MMIWDDTDREFIYVWWNVWMYIHSNIVCTCKRKVWRTRESLDDWTLMIKEKKEKKNSAKNSTKKIYRRICNLRVPKLKFSTTIRGNRQRYISPRFFFFFLSPDRLQWIRIRIEINSRRTRTAMMTRWDLRKWTRNLRSRQYIAAISFEREPWILASRPFFTSRISILGYVRLTTPSPSLSSSSSLSNRFFVALLAVGNNIVDPLLSSRISV